MDHITIMGIRLDHRARSAPRVQEILTKHGSTIISRLGIPDPSKEDGLITLYMKAAADEVQELSRELSSIEGVTINTMKL